VKYIRLLVITIIVINFSFTSAGINLFFIDDYSGDILIEGTQKPINNIYKNIYNFRSACPNIRFPQNHNDPVDDFIFSPENITLEDDALHRSNSLHFTEWWYFDAVFNNGYTAQMNIRISSILNQDVLNIRLDIYREGVLLSHEVKRYLQWDFYASTDIPFVEIQGKQVMKGFIDETTGKWIYNFQLECDKTSANLQFIGTTQGWKGSIPNGQWAVVLPKAEVNGSITIFNEEINVTGRGYHDHNWEITAFTGMNYGWFWGKINAETLTMTWAKIMNTRLWGQSLLVINKDNEGYTTIEADDIYLFTSDFHVDKGMLVPHSFTLEAYNKNFSLSVNMEVIETHHERMFGIVNYWRYHMVCNGTINCDSYTEIIEEIQIAEFIRFR